MANIDSVYGVRLVLVALFCFLHISITECAPGSTPNIDRIFIGRCLQYQELTKGTLIEPVQVNCTQLWTVFKKAWAYKEPRSVVRADFDDFFDTAKQNNLPEDKILLWSGTYGIAHEYSNQGKRYVTLEDSLIGYLVNGLTWCGVVCSGCDGINYVECPEYSDLPREANQAFWGGASSTFARMASGVVRLMVSGTNENRPAYSRDSYFGQFELPSFSPKAHLQVILVNFLDKIPLEHCNTGSLIELQKDVEDRGMSYSCSENPLDVLHLMCVSDPSAAKCEIDEPRKGLSAPQSLPDLLSGRVRQNNPLHYDPLT